ncbi:TM2 domain-containing protein [Maribacter sp. ACAM166]|uniref:TM2 domain-containing protein n=1 Tax=Maribacter sp. ACAM166 TaxID=2508996 RepID=UPI0010FDB4B6|nr:NINE protein [Maribacter sp. ACAM166]TLP76946.1 TM2 domain-containing protein [Maribacter sp. ACAM166]
MSDNNKDLGEQAEDAMDNAKKKAENLGDKSKKETKDFGEKAEDTFEKTKKKTEKAYDDAKEFSEDTKESTNEFSENAKKTANEFTAGAKEAFSGAGGENKKMLAGILAIVIGSLGIHKFILGYQKEGIIMLVVTIVLGAVTCGIGASAMWVVGIIEGIIYLTKSDEEFYNTYQVGKKPWF